MLEEKEVWLVFQAHMMTSTRVPGALEIGNGLEKLSGK
jgi:hypothetical protein